MNNAWFMRNRANFVTWARIVLCAFLVWPIIWHREWLATVILPLLVVAGATDRLDGWIATKYGIASEFGGRLDRIADKCFLAPSFVFFLLDWRIYFLSKIFTILLAGVEIALTYYLIAGWKMKMDVSTVKRAKGYGFGQIKMALLCAAIYLQQLSIIVVQHTGLRYHIISIVLVNLMLAAGLVYAVLSLRGHRARHRARLLQPTQVPVG